MTEEIENRLADETAPERPRLCMACGHRSMGRGEASMRCDNSACGSWDAVNMDPAAARYVRAMRAGDTYGHEVR